VIGGSAGAIRALCSILPSLPADLPAPLVVVIHVPEKESQLAAVLQRCCALEVVKSTKPSPLRAGKVYIAPPNRHLVVKGGCVSAVMGPRENRHRPSVDTLFRSAARAYRRSVVGLILTGALDDGVAGAVAIKARGGTVLVQDPDDAEVPDMPANVLRQVRDVRSARLDDIAGLLIRLVSGQRGPELPEANARECRQPLNKAIEANITEPVAFACPECDGALLQITDGRTTQLRCHVGHRYTLDSFSEAHSEAVERALWVALRKLRERQRIQEQLAGDRSMSPDMRRRFQEDGAAAATDIELLEQVLTHL